MRRGLPVSPGVAVGTVYRINEIVLSHGKQRLHADEDIAGELAKYDNARERAAQDLRAVEDKVASHVGRKEAAIFAAHRSILQDSAFTKTVCAWIVEEHLTAQAALRRLLDHYTEVFSRIQDDYLRERLHDIRDVVVRVNSNLQGPAESVAENLTGPVIVVAEELLPSHVVMLGDVEVKGIVTEGGSQTSHAAIVARSRGIPAVSGVEGIVAQVKTGDTIIVDGKEGRVILHPDVETRAAYRKLEREFFHFKDQLAENHHLSAVTADEVPLELLANVNCVSDAQAAAAMGATGVGLFRTEYLYLAHPAVPGEEEQLEEYCNVIRRSPQHRVTIRTLDLGGDKTVPFLGHTHREANPFMGWRSIRLCFEHPEFLSTQLRAIMRAAALAQELGGGVKLMFPMITTLEEIHRVHSLLRRARNQLAKEGQAFAEVPTGIMLEVPAAAISIDAMLSQVDFISIGSNDLVQYLMAADRDNPKVAHLCQPLAPSVLRVLSQVIRACTAAKTPVTLCGEMAGQPRAFALLLGMGLRSFSMSPAFVPYIKEFARYLSIERTERIVRHALSLKTTSSVTHYVTQQLSAICPAFAERFNYA